MTTPQTRNATSLDCSNSQGSFNASSPPCRADSAAANLADPAKCQSDPGQVVSQDPFAYYKAFLSTSVPSGSGPTQLDNGYTDHSHSVETQTTHHIGSHRLHRTRSGPYNLAVRLANRSNGGTLATIIEQGSYSTLNSYGSHLSVARFPSIRVVENVSPKCNARRNSQPRSEKPLQNIDEDFVPSEYVVPIQEGFHATLDESHDGPNTEYDPDTRIQLGSVELHQTPVTPRNEVGRNESSGLMGFLRGVLHNVRSASPSDFKTPSISNPTQDDYSKEGQNKQSPNLRTQNPQPGLDFDQAISGAAYNSSHVQISASDSLPTDNHSRSNPECQIKSGMGLSTGCELSVRVHRSAIHPTIAITEPNTGSDPAPHLLLPMNVTHTRDQPFFARPVPPETRDEAAQVPSTAGVLAPPKYSKGDVSAGNSADVASLSRNNAPSSRESDCMRATSRSASFCSTRSTSYSGTVLGVDLDLQQDSPPKVRRSPTPVWFTPQMDELERQAASSESPKPQRNVAADTSQRSIISSALPTLLPIAEASGIVQPNYNTPKLSFFSPSGNLIQAEESLVSGESQSDYQETPVIKTSYYNNPNAISAYDGLSALSGLPPARPSLVPMTTPPSPLKINSSLPAHLKHRRNYHHAEKTEISSPSVWIRATPKIKGCGGMVSRQNSLTPRSGVGQTKSRGHHKSCRSKTQSLACRFNIEIFRSRCTPLASCGKSQKGKTLQKRSPASTSKPRQRLTGSKRVKAAEKFGPLAGQALRLCFCQPHDGAGPAEKGCTGIAKNLRDQCDDAGYLQQAREAETENVRIVSGKNNASQKGKRRRSDSAASVGIQAGVLGEGIDEG